MPSLAGLRRNLAALMLIFCAWRGEAATKRAGRWEARMVAVRAWGEGAAS